MNKNIRRINHKETSMIAISHKNKTWKNKSLKSI